MKRITNKKIYHCYYWWISWPRQKPGVIQVGDYTKMKNHLYQLLYNTYAKSIHHHYHYNVGISKQGREMKWLKAANEAILPVYQ